MRAFDEQLLRLKQALKVTSDQEVAQLLGMTKAAFSDRKRRDAFPEDKLWALAQQRPELSLEPLVILTGASEAVLKAASHVAAAQLGLAVQMQAGKGVSLGEQLKRATAVIERLHDALPADEAMLLEAYRALDPAHKRKVLAVALNPIEPVFEPPPTPKRTSIHQSSSGAGSIQVGHAKGKVTVKTQRGNK